MLKTITANNLYTIICLQAFSCNVRYKSLIQEKVHPCKMQLLKVNKSISRTHKKFENKKIYQNRKNISLLLQKYDIKMNGFNSNNKIFNQSSWIVEKKIMLLQELGVSIITPFYIIKFNRGMCLSVHLFKANTLINNQVNLSKNLLSSVTNKTHLYKYLMESSHISMKRVFANCLIYYLRQEHNFSYDQLRLIHIKTRWLWNNSFRLIKEVIEFLKNELRFTNAHIAKNHWVLSYHPKKIKLIYNQFYANFKEDSYKIILGNPKVLNLELHNLQKFIKIFHKYNIKTEEIRTYPSIFQYNPIELERKIATIINNPLTLVYTKHPRFLSLIIHYISVIRRLQYLEEHNIQFFTITGLTDKTAFSKLLNSIKYKLTRNNLFYFIEKEFENDAEALIMIIQNHPFWMYVPLIQMYESLSYLRQKFEENVIRQHIYAILYKRSDIEIEYQTNRPEYSYLKKNEKLGFIIYNIEKKSNFTGAVVLSTFDDEMQSLNNNNSSAT